ncbi:MAG: hypothetical protein HOE90_21100 [Bacteriovoracaceae bacterium]|jgi:hypothetical protein|nr:hypothetical protein [Bacteriovoracaceae bacterium]
MFKLASFLLIFLPLFLSSCGIKEVIVANFDLILTKKIGDEFHLNSYQRDSLKKDIQSYLKNQKMLASSLLKQLEKHQIKNAVVSDDFIYLKGIYTEIAVSFSAILSKYLAQLNPYQLGKFKQNLQQRNQSLKISTLANTSPAKKRFGKFFGDLREDQINLIKGGSDIFNKISQQRYDRRLSFQRDLLDLLGSNEPVHRKQELVHKLFTQYNLKLKFGHEQKLAMGITQKIVSGLGSSQIDYFSDKKNDIKDWIAIYIKYHE